MGFDAVLGCKMRGFVGKILEDWHLGVVFGDQDDKRGHQLGNCSGLKGTLVAQYSSYGPICLDKV